jgi:chorismate dehydratase
LLIGDPALSLVVDPSYSVFDLANLWRENTGLGFIFAMWMTRRERVDIDFAAARDEGLGHLDEIVANYDPQIPLSRDELYQYLSSNIAYKPDESMLAGLELYLDLAAKHRLIEQQTPAIRYLA